MEDFWTNTTHLQRTKNCLGIRGHCVVCFMQLCLVQTLSRNSGFIGYELDGSTPFCLQICSTSMIEFYAVLLCCIVFYCVYLLSSPCFQFSLAWVCPRQTNSDAMCSPKSFHQKAPVLARREVRPVSRRSLSCTFEHCTCFEDILCIQRDIIGHHWPWC